MAWGPLGAIVPMLINALVGIVLGGVLVLLFGLGKKIVKRKPAT